MAASAAVIRGLARASSESSAPVAASRSMSGRSSSSGPSGERVGEHDRVANGEERPENGAGGPRLPGGLRARALGLGERHLGLERFQRPGRLQLEPAGRGVREALGDGDRRVREREPSVGGDGLDVGERRPEADAAAERVALDLGLAQERVGRAALGLVEGGEPERLRRTQARLRPPEPAVDGGHAVHAQEELRRGQDACALAPGGLSRDGRRADPQLRGHGLGLVERPGQRQTAGGEPGHVLRLGRPCAEQEREGERGSQAWTAPRLGVAERVAVAVRVGAADGRGRRRPVRVDLSVQRAVEVRPNTSRRPGGRPAPGPIRSRRRRSGARRASGRCS